MPGRESPADSELFLPAEELPVAEGVYGPWLPKDDSGRYGVAGESAAATATRTASEGGSGRADDAGLPATCLGQVAESLGATSLSGRSYADFGGYGAAAAEYVLAFPSAQEAGRAAIRLRAAMECGPAGVTALFCSSDVIAVQLWPGGRGPAEVEEITVQQAGSRLVALAVHRPAGATGVPSGSPDPLRQGLVRPEFYAAVDSLRARVAEAAATDGTTPGATPGAGTDVPSGTASPEPIDVTGAEQCEGA
ncbi:hypothetical protein [Kitasatospora sp. NPDC057015]|uniref:hypothetical protein n=1 Tax=Kitasatospora sp. NPDC057015 TaxID=3346001 RepID=UPI003631D9BB